MAKPDSTNGPFTGSCVCGAISYQAEALRPLWYCHCQQCRNMTGHYMAAAQVDLKQLSINGDPRWYYVSEHSRHGFCADCGAQLFWRNDNNEYLSITGGSLDDTSRLEVSGHVFASEKGDYYEVPEKQLQYAQWCLEGEI